MKSSKAREIIERAMEDRAVYAAMAARESEVWGKILPALEHSEARAADARSSASLRIGRHMGSLIEIAKQKGLHFKHGLTLGCGAGRLERTLLEQGICERFHGIDISAQAVADAQETSERDGLPITYEVGDLNFIVLPKNAFDLVVAQTSLHHILFLERVAEQISGALEHTGYLWIHDFIGETQGQYDSKRLSLLNQLLSILPEKFRTNKINGRVTARIERPEPGRLGSPFEKIRSEEIVPVFENWFTIEWRKEFTSLLHLIAPPGTRAAFTENEDTRALFEVLILLDHLCIEEGILQPIGGQYLMRPKASALSPGRGPT
ncbi:MAG: methyltransferase domain-containing protein [Spartobacteria bacterium]